MAFCCDRLQTPSTALERPEYPLRSINYASGNFVLSASSTKFSLDLATITILGQPPGSCPFFTLKHSWLSRARKNPCPYQSPYCQNIPEFQVLGNH